VITILIEVIRDISKVIHNKELSDDEKRVLSKKFMRAGIIFTLFFTALTVLTLFFHNPEVHVSILWYLFFLGIFIIFRIFLIILSTQTANKKD